MLDGVVAVLECWKGRLGRRGDGVWNTVPCVLCGLFGGSGIGGLSRGPKGQW